MMYTLTKETTARRIIESLYTKIELKDRVRVVYALIDSSPTLMVFVPNPDYDPRNINPGVLEADPADRVLFTVKPVLTEEQWKSPLTTKNLMDLTCRNFTIDGSLVDQGLVAKVEQEL